MPERLTDTMRGRERLVGRTRAARFGMSYSRSRCLCGDGALPSQDHAFSQFPWALGAALASAELRGPMLALWAASSAWCRPENPYVPSASKVVSAFALFIDYVSAILASRSASPGCQRRPRLCACAANAGWPREHVGASGPAAQKFRSSSWPWQDRLAGVLFNPSPRSGHLP